MRTLMGSLLMAEKDEHYLNFIADRYFSHEKSSAEYRIILFYLLKMLYEEKLSVDLATELFKRLKGLKASPVPNIFSKYSVYDDNETRAKAYVELYKSGVLECKHKLFDLIKSCDEHTRYNIIDYILSRTCIQDVFEYYGCVENIKAESEDIKIILLSHISDLNLLRHMDFVLSMLRDENRSVRFFAMRCALKLDKSMADQLIDIAIRDDYENIRKFAILYIGALKYYKKLHEIERILEKEDEHTSVMVAAIRSLCRFERLNNIDKLKQFINHHNEEVRSAALFALLHFHLITPEEAIEIAKQNKSDHSQLLILQLFVRKYPQLLPSLLSSMEFKDKPRTCSYVVKLADRTQELWLIPYLNKIKQVDPHNNGFYADLIIHNLMNHPLAPLLDALILGKYGDWYPHILRIYNKINPEYKKIIDEFLLSRLSLHDEFERRRSIDILCKFNPKLIRCCISNSISGKEGEKSDYIFKREDVSYLISKINKENKEIYHDIIKHIALVYRNDEDIILKCLDAMIYLDAKKALLFIEEIILDQDYKEDIRANLIRYLTEFMSNDFLPFIDAIVNQNKHFPLIMQACLEFLICLKNRDAYFFILKNTDKFLDYIKKYDYIKDNDSLMDDNAFLIASCVFIKQNQERFNDVLEVFKYLVPHKMSAFLYWVIQNMPEITIRKSVLEIIMR